jgi:GntR family trehalose operon transcriptional repressor
MSKYKDIFQTLQTDIENGTYPPGSKLPGEFELMKMYSASRDTVRKSLSLLVQNGYIQKLRGYGSAVLDIPHTGPDTTQTEVLLADESLTKEVLSVEFDADDLYAGIVRYEQEPVWKVIRLMRKNGSGVILQTDYVSSAVMPELQTETLNLILSGSHAASCSETEITCEPADESDGQYLFLQNTPFVIQCESRYFRDDGRIVCLSISHQPHTFFRCRKFNRLIKKA